MSRELTNKLLGSKVIELAKDTSVIDTYSLCGSKHEAWIYITDEDEDGTPNAVSDSIIVAFTALDSSGVGCFDKIFEGALVFLTDPEEWESTVDEGLDILQQRFNDCTPGWDCAADLALAGTYAGIYGVVTAASYVGGGLFDAGKSVGNFLCVWCDEDHAEDEADYIRNMVLKTESSQGEVTTCNPKKGLTGEFWGTTYHNTNAGEHKVKITINKLYQGKTTTVYQSELAASDGYKKKDGALMFEPSYRKFKLNGPGTYTVNVKSLAANMDCGNPSLDLNTSIVVAEAPEGESSDNPVATLNQGVTDITEAIGIRPLYIYGGAVALGGLLVANYLRNLSGSGEDDESE
jgi:hypothetical protein